LRVVVLPDLRFHYHINRLFERERAQDIEQVKERVQKSIERENYKRDTLDVDAARTSDSVPVLLALSFCACL
jgi:hypothetical protein